MPLSVAYMTAWVTAILASVAAREYRVLRWALSRLGMAMEARMLTMETAISN
jgi:hypothetical protein